LYMLHEMGIETGIDLDLALKSAQLIERTLGKSLKSRQMEILRAEGKERIS
jgi:hydroxymethylglutaryl-CoA lyase